MDNLPSHKVAGVRETIEAAGAELADLPSYSPDPKPPLATPPSFARRSLWLASPIEMAFSKSKALLGKAAERTIPALSDRIDALIDAYPPQECANYFKHAGYA